MLEGHYSETIPPATMVWRLLTHDSGEQNISTQQTMMVHFQHNEGKKPDAAFTLVDVLVSFMVVGFVLGGIAYGYVQANRMAEWSSMSLAAQSYASQGVEQLRAAKWDTQLYTTNTGVGTPDETGPTYSTIYFDVLDVPASGSPLYATNYIKLTTISQSPNPPLRQIRCDCAWQFPTTGIYYTNTVVTLRAPDE
jgi:type II secretory pathway pseudopilin PulG